MIKPVGRAVDITGKKYGMLTVITQQKMNKDPDYDRGIYS